MKKEIPILFSTPMVQAILDGNKFMTRRVVKPQPQKLTSGPFGGNAGFIEGDHAFIDGVGCIVSCKKNGPDGWAEKQSKWKNGDILWVREKWKHNPSKMTGSPIQFYANNDNDFTHPDNEKWKPSIHMKKAHARIWLEVTNVRVERLQDISNEDATAEGIEYRKFTGGLGYKMYGVGTDDQMTSYPKVSFKSLWESINGWENWKANPWVWVISFKVLSTTGKPNTI